MDLKESFVESINDHLDIIHKVSNVYAHTTEDREDLFQEIIYQLWRSYGSYRKEAKFSTWMYRVAINTALMTLRKCSPDYENLAIPVETIKYEEQTGSGEEIEILYKAINQLNCSEKAIILLYLEQKSYREIAEVIGLTEKNISVKIVRIKEKLQKKISNYYKEH